MSVDVVVQHQDVSKSDLAVLILNDTATTEIYTYDTRVPYTTPFRTADRSTRQRGGGPADGLAARHRLGAPARPDADRSCQPRRRRLRRQREQPSPRARYRDAGGADGRYRNRHLHHRVDRPGRQPGDRRL